MDFILSFGKKVWKYRWILERDVWVPVIVPSANTIARSSCRLDHQDRPLLFQFLQWFPQWSSYCYKSQTKKPELEKTRLFVKAYGLHVNK